MAKILFVWELGKGFGHLAPYLDLVDNLRANGHEVVFAARDVGHTEQVFGKHHVTIVQAPIMMHSIRDPYRVQYNFSHLLHNTGFGERVSLVGLVKAWRRLYDYLQPDLVIFDHSPTALLAARGYRWKRIVSGSGFLIPPAAVPLPMMRYWQQYDQKRLLKEENRLLENMNHSLASVGEAPLDSVSQLYVADELFLLGFEEMDHYPQRGGGNYLGMFSPPNHGVPPEWPPGYERRIFAYLHPYKNIGELMKLFSAGRFATLIYAPELPDALKKRHRSKHVVFSDEPVDISRAARECDFAVTNATFGTTAAVLLCGTPVLCIPSNLERLMVARRVIDMGAGIGVERQKPEKLKPALRALFTQDRYASAARRFGEKYGHLDQNWQTGEMMDVVNRLAPSRIAAESDPGVRVEAS